MDKKPTRREVEIEWGRRYPFIGRTENWGTAEFVVCPVFKYGHITDFHCFSKQQEDAVHYFGNVKGLERTGLWFSSYEGLGDASVWRTFWCKEHKSHSMALYVPSGSGAIAFEITLEFIGISFFGSMV